jgi:hypothetical protein
MLDTSYASECVRGAVFSTRHLHRNRGYVCMGLSSPAHFQPVLPQLSNVTVAEFFASKYACLNYPNMPCLTAWASDGVTPLFLPLEVCRVESSHLSEQAFPPTVNPSNIGAAQSAPQQQRHQQNVPDFTGSEPGKNSEGCVAGGGSTGVAGLDTGLFAIGQKYQDPWPPQSSVHIHTYTHTYIHTYIQILKSQFSRQTPSSASVPV